jgi:ATP-binding cassette subfamily B protein
MFKLAKYLKPFIGAVIAAILLLFVQAICDLNLPKFMSDIVNVGIQQSGVEEKAPRAVSSNGYKLAQAFMNNDEKRLAEDSYILVKPGETDGSGRAYNVEYPSASEDGFYVLKAGISDEQHTELDNAFGLSTWTMVKVLTDLQEQSKQQGQTGATELNKTTEASVATETSEATEAIEPNKATETSIQNINLEEVYEILPIINSLPQSAIEEARAQAESMDPLMRAQSATMLTVSYYKELGVNIEQKEIGYIVRIGLIMLFITLVSGTATVLVGLFSSRAGAGMARDLRHDIFTKISDFSHTEFDRFSTASLITRSTNDVTQIQMLITLGLRMMCYAPIMGVGAIIMALQTSVSMSWIIALAVLVMICAVGLLMIVVMPKFRIIQRLIDRLNLVARETLNGLMVIRAFGRGKFEKERFEHANDDVTKTNLFIQRAMVFMMPLMLIFMNALTVLIIWIGAEQVVASQMQVGDMMAYLQYAMMVVMAFMFITMAFIFMPRAAVSAGRIAEVLDTEPVIKDPAVPTPLLPEKRGTVEFRNVGFRYDGAEQNALCNISFVARPGTTTAFIGSTGSGKSTILNLIPRFYDVTEGAVLVNGVDVREVSQQELRSHIGYVPQKTVLMSGSVASNITYGNPDLPQEDVEKVAEVSQALAFIQKLAAENNESDKGDEANEAATDDTAGFAAEIAQGGANVSGGQRQRLSIARALAVNPDIFLFDDSFSALDFATDAALRKALAKYTTNATMLIVAQRVSTIMEADQIYVIDDGVVVGSGTHSELLKSCPAYLEIASTQLTAEELKGGAQ